MLPFGITSVPEFFQKQMSEFLRGCEGVVGLVDDVLGHSRYVEEHHGRVMAILETLNNAGVTLNKDKCRSKRLCTTVTASQKMLEPYIPGKQTVKEHDQQQKENHYIVL